MSRYKKAFVMLTSCRPIDDWAWLLGGVVIVTPLLDRRVHHGHLPKASDLKKRPSGTQLGARRSNIQANVEHFAWPPLEHFHVAIRG